MLAFDDESLARLIRAAGKVSYRKRGRWLRKIAHELDPSPNALRLARARKRQDNGIGYYRLQLDTVEVEALLCREGYLVASKDYDRAAIEQALALFIAELCKFDMHVEPESGNGL